jgi:CubicO group peptidase (beta-lactamase class C family)
VSADRYGPARRILDEAVGARAFPAVVAEVGQAAGPLWCHAAGRLTYDTDAPAAGRETVFDLASLTKVISTTTLAMHLVAEGAMSLDDPASTWLAEWRGSDRTDVSVRDLLSHTSGLPGHLPLYEDHAGRADYQRTLATLPLEYAPRTRAVYSDLGFILLGFILEDAGGAPLAQLFERVSRVVEPEPLKFNPPRSWRAHIAPTEVDPWRGRLLVGEVHDENAWALGGVAGHAGLFGTAAAVGRFARATLRLLAGAPASQETATARLFARRREAIPNSSRALGWDTMLPTSSCGQRMSSASIGHTGFTGTSIWIDPEADVYVVLLTNRVHPTRRNDAILGVRPAFHDAVMCALRARGPAPPM